MRRMTRRPTHPGRIIKEDYLLPLSITIREMAQNVQYGGLDEKIY
ncbi:MAG: hypothetical protein U9R43_15800 [Thermodesulfobacteriota bacterium]|nr:hypothetical protein [Thermodesulfobacteriota bacterium]